jgi:TIR domain
MVAKVFISYRRDDSAGSAGRVHDRLVHEFGSDLSFMDVDSVPLGVNYAAFLDAEVSKCAVLLAVIGPNWLDAKDEEGNRRLDDPGDLVRVEIAAALLRDIPVIPILLDEARVPKSSQLPENLRELALRNGLKVRHDSFHGDMNKLIGSLRGLLEKVDPLTSPQKQDNIPDTLRRSWPAPEEREQGEKAAARQKAEAERQRQEAEAKRRPEEHPHQSTAEEDRRKLEASSEPPKIFLSFASEDYPYVSLFTEWFTLQLGDVAVHEFKGGDNLNFGELNQWIDEHLNSAAAVIVFLSEYYVRKKYTIEESIKTMSEVRRRRLIFVPIVLDAEAKFWWVDLRRRGNLNVLADDFIYSDFTQGGRRQAIAGNDVVQAKIGEIARSIGRVLTRLRAD